MDNGCVNLANYRNPPELNKGRGFFMRALWHIVNAVVLQSPLNPSSKLKTIALKAFGAEIGSGCVFKPGINVKSPWNLRLGNNCWVGERVWIDSLASVVVGDNVCLSQGAYLCCGNHDWSDPAFRKTISEIVIEDGAWIATFAVVMPGVHIASHTVVAAGAIITKDTLPYTVYAGNPAIPVKKRVIKAR